MKKVSLFVLVFCIIFSTVSFANYCGNDEWPRIIHWNNGPTPSGPPVYNYPNNTSYNFVPSYQTNFDCRSISIPTPQVVYDTDGIIPIGNFIERAGSVYFCYLNGVFARNTWLKTKGKWYYFDSKGYMESDAYRGGYYVAKSGAYDDKGKAQWKKDKKGWWYQLPDGKYLKNCWKKINGKWYYFKSNGYAAANEWVKGYYWLNKDCAWIYQPKGKWKKDKKGWWFGDTSGWYAKKGTYTINGKAYQFDKQGYCINP